MVIAVVALAVAAITLFRSDPKNGNADSPDPENGSSFISEGLLERIDETGVLHAGYGVYPPYTQEDPNTQAVSGFSVDIINHIASELKCEVVWHRLNWNTMSADLKRGEYDVIADPIFQTIPRGREFAFTEPYAYFADGIAVVMASDTRFTDFKDIDRQGITVAVGQGWASEVLVRSQFTRASIVPIQTTTDLLQVFNEVIAGRADVAIADAADAIRFVQEHSKDVKALFLDNPPAFMPAGFALRPNDSRGAEFLTICLRNIRATGVLEGIANKYELPSRTDLEGSK
jgi:ABC-type amino acid transport substrate-binding protein